MQRRFDETVSVRLDLLVLYLATFVTRVGFGVIVVAFPRYVLADSFTTGIVLAIYPLLEAVSAAPVGMFVDRHGRRDMMLAGLILVTLLTFSVGLSRYTVFIALVHGAMGVSAAAVTVSTLTMITDLTGRSYRGTGMGVFDLANLSGYAGGILLGTWIYVLFESTPGYVFYSTAAILLAASIVTLALLVEPRHEELKGRIPLNFLKSLSWKVISFLPIWLALTTLVGIAFYIPKALAKGGFSVTSSGLLLFAAVLGVGMGSTFFGRVSDKIGREKTAAIGAAGVLTVLPALALSMSPTTNPAYPGFGYFIFLIGPAALFASAVVPSVLALVGDMVKTSLRGSAMGMYSVMLSLGIAIGNVVGGYYDQIGGLSTVLYAGEAVFVVATLITILLYRFKQDSL